LNTSTSGDFFFKLAKSNSDEIREVCRELGISREELEPGYINKGLHVPSDAQKFNYERYEEIRKGIIRHSIRKTSTSKRSTSQKTL